MICPVRSPDLVWAVSVVHWLGSQNKNPKGMRDMLSLPLPEGQNESVIYLEELGSINPLSALQGLTLGNYISQAALPAGSGQWEALVEPGMWGERGRRAPSPLSGFHLCVFSTGRLSQCCQLLPGSPRCCQLPPAGSDPGLRASWQHLLLLSSQPVGFLLLLISESQCGSYLFFQQFRHVTG